MKSLLEMFPRASKSFIKANEGGDATWTKGSSSPTDTRGQSESVSNAAPKFDPLGRGKMNKTEAAYALLLEAQLQKGEILSYHFQGLTLRWPVGDEIVKYTPDFVVFRPRMWKGITLLEPEIKLIEVKGSYRKFPGYLERAIERFRHAKTRWPQFSFELWKKEKSGWKQIH